MGRKPNALIHEFFERGAKLEDSSNRYQHTCKSCGEKFPKGRIDSLTNHLIKSCPAVSQADRQRAIQTLNQKSIQPAPYHQPTVEFNHDQSTTADPVFAAPPSMSALETLAEVSRQQLGSTGQYVPTTQNSKKRKRGSMRKDIEQQPLLETDLLMQDPQQFLALAGPNPANDAVESIYAAMSKEPTYGTSSLDITDFATIFRNMEHPTSDQNFELATTSAEEVDQSMNAPTARMIPDHDQLMLAAAASAATEIMPKMEVEEDPSETLGTVPGSDGGSYFQYPLADDPAMIDPQLQDDGPSSRLVPQMQMQMQAPVVQAMTLQPRPSSVNPNLPHAPYLHDFRLNGDPHKSKTRGRFTPNRRKEVQEVRRQGACIRCRMLKKPCSGGTPCSTCINVESARLWKSPCMRARIADEFDLYSSHLHHTLSYREVNRAHKNGIAIPQLSHIIQATHFLKLDLLPLTLPTIRGLKAASPTTDATVIGFEDPHQTPTIDVELLNQDSEGIPQQLDQYIKRVSRQVSESEPSRFMRSTLILAAQIVTSNPDTLLSRALDLWTGTMILVDPNLHWHLNSSAATTAAGDINVRRAENLAITSPLSYRLLSNQIRAHVEKRCSLLAKNLMNDLERRLLQRGQTPGNHFETFLTSVILLNCVEKMCWLYSTWAQKLADQAGTTNGANGHVNDMLDGDEATWPLDRDPQSFVVKGDSVADVVSMLLRMRSVPPATIVGADGLLHLDTRAQAAKTRDVVQQSQSIGNDNDADIVAWFEGIGMSVEDLVKARDTPRWDQRDCRCWDLKYISRIISPEV